MFLFGLFTFSKDEKNLFLKAKEINKSFAQAFSYELACISTLFSLFLFIDRYLALIFYYFFLYTVFECKFRPQESQSDVLGGTCVG